MAEGELKESIVESPTTLMQKPRWENGDIMSWSAGPTFGARVKTLTPKLPTSQILAKITRIAELHLLFQQRLVLVAISVKVRACLR